jgi:hypothetical protein
LSSHYYFVSSLPLLSYDDRSSRDPATFLQIARSHLTEHDLAKISRCRIDAPDVVELETRVGSEYARFERGLRNALVALRAPRRGADPEESIRRDRQGNDDSDQTGVRDLARTAVAEESALAAEDILNRARWSRLDELEAGHYFDTEALAIYYLRLQVLARRSLFHRQEGETRYNEAIESITNDYYQEPKQS